MESAKSAFSQAHKVILISAGSLLLLLTLFIWRSLPYRLKQFNASTANIATDAVL